ncbi:Helix-turn-helix domain-containing protein [Nocardia amikacinitolerans]|uniref:Helix-turn-helix domain-containing protein n=1 Tax=Nocardia amikacinitolerans TaxID=756689 RepID=A0A285LWZ8_9NOCA|nr:helix-turn-helix transcriptional regulator [Nocardia amikacinitolerans]SNY88667.1 Helix-turn-helix domain-containing protein [Nocardia amikacinitolerans]
MSNSAAATVGHRIRRARRTKKMSQATLGSLVDRSETWMRGIEAGRIALDKHSVIERLAKVLEVDVGWMLGRPFEFGEETGHSAVPALRSALRRTGLVLSGHPGLHQATPKMLLTDLRADVDRVTRRRQAANLLEVMRQLPDLAEALNTSALEARGSERDVVHGLIIEASNVARMVLNQLGYHDLAWTAVDNAATAAAELGDPLMSACAAWDRCGVLLHTGSLGEVITIAEAALTELRDYMKEPTPQVLSLWGALHLRCAVAAARRCDAIAAWGYLAEAEATATRLGNDRNDFQTVFGPTNCSIHAAEVAVELGRPDIALRRHVSIDLSALTSIERHTRHRIDVGRAYGQLKHDAAAVEQLKQAVALAPHYVYNHPMARDLVGALACRSQPSAVDAGLGALERAMGLA